MEVCKPKETAAVHHLQVYSRDSKRQKRKQSTNMPSTSCMPDKLILEHILDILQRRDTNEIFAQPVDPKEVEGYYKIIKEPMDFGTVRAKLHERMYSSLEQFEHDVFLISRNAMQFNSWATIYFRQARAIHELAKRVFHILKTDPVGFGSKILQRKVNSEAKVSSSPKSRSSSESSKASLSSTCVPADNSKEDKVWHSAWSVFASNNSRREISRDSKRNREKISRNEVDRRSTYGNWTCFLKKDKTALLDACNGSRGLISVDLTSLKYEESLMMFTKSLGPTAQRIAADKTSGLSCPSNCK